MTLQLNIFKTENEAAHALASAVAADLERALAASSRSSERALLLVSGGRSPLPFFAALSDQDLPWDRIDVSLVDERSVPADHADSNAALVARHLLQGRAQAARLLSLMAPAVSEEDPWHWAQRSAERADADPSLARPAAVVLGLGTDGHTASLFPDAPQWQEAIATERRYVALKPAQAPHARVSMSLSALVAQRRCYVWSNGEAKLQVIRQAEGLVAGVAEGLLDAIAMQSAGPFALLLAHPDVTLQVFHNN
jgi:6-phosphogluconolactonase